MIHTINSYYFNCLIFNGKKSIYYRTKIELLIRDSFTTLLSTKHCTRTDRTLFMYRRVPGLNFHPERRLSSLANFVVFSSKQK